MRHRIRTRRLGRTTPHKKAMMRNLVTSLIKYGRIKTTVTRAKELQMLADKMITLGKDGSLHSRRQALAVIHEKPVVVKLFEEIAPEFNQRQGGYTRIIKIGPRQGDSSPMCYIEFVESTFSMKKNKTEKSVQTSSSVDDKATEASVIPVAAQAQEEEMSEVITEDELHEESNTSEDLTKEDDQEEQAAESSESEAEEVIVEQDEESKKSL